MHYCEMLVGGGAPGSHDEPCDEPASVKYQGQWFCERHYEALVDLDTRWEALLRVADQYPPHEGEGSCEDGEGGLPEFEVEGVTTTSRMHPRCTPGSAAKGRTLPQQGRVRSDSDDYRLA